MEYNGRELYAKYLAHKAHKYVKRERRNGEWVYYYDDASATPAKPKGDASDQVLTKRQAARNTTPKGDASDQVLTKRQAARNTTPAGDASDQVLTKRQAATNYKKPLSKGSEADLSKNVLTRKESAKSNSAPAKSNSNDGDLNDYVLTKRQAARNATPKGDASDQVLTKRQAARRVEQQTKSGDAAKTSASKEYKEEAASNSRKNVGPGGTSMEGKKVYNWDASSQTWKDVTDDVYNKKSTKKGKSWLDKIFGR